MEENENTVSLNYLMADHWELVDGTNGRSRLSKFELRVFSYDEFEFDEEDDIFLGEVNQINLTNSREFQMKTM